MYVFVCKGMSEKNVKCLNECVGRITKKTNTGIAVCVHVSFCNTIIEEDGREKLKARFI